MLLLWNKFSLKLILVKNIYCFHFFLALYWKIFDLQKFAAQQYNGKYFPLVPHSWKIFYNFDLQTIFNGKHFTYPSTGGHLLFQRSKVKHSNFQIGESWEIKEDIITNIYL